MSEKKWYEFDQGVKVEDCLYMAKNKLAEGVKENLRARISRGLDDGMRALGDGPPERADMFQQAFMKQINEFFEGKCTDPSFITNMVAAGGLNANGIDLALEQLEVNCGVPAQEHLPRVQSVCACFDGFLEGSPDYDLIRERLAIRLRGEIRSEIDLPQLEEAPKAQRRM